MAKNEPTRNERPDGGTIRGNQKPSKSTTPDNRPNPKGDASKNERS